MSEGSGGTGKYTHIMWEDARKWLAGLHQKLQNLVDRVPPDVDKVAISFAQQLEVLLRHIAVLEYFLAEGTDSPVRARAQALVDNTLGH